MEIETTFNMCVPQELITHFSHFKFQNASETTKPTRLHQSVTKTKHKYVK